MTWLLALAGLAALIDWVAVDRGLVRLEEAAKPAVPIALLAWVASASDSGGTSRGWVLVALALCLAGDVALLPRLDRFVVGLGAFLLGHLAFLPALLAAADTGALVVTSIVVALAALPAGWRISRAAGQRGGSALARAVVVYIAAVGTTAAAAAATLLLPVAAGGVLFACSDGVLGWNRFVAPVPHGRTITHVTYHLALAGLASIVVVA